MIVIIASCDSNKTNDASSSRSSMEDSIVFVDRLNTDSILNLEMDLDSLKRKISNQTNNKNINRKDTIKYEFSLEDDYGTEGNEGFAIYVNKKISKASIVLYREKGQVNINYLFFNNVINVTETIYTYKVQFSEVSTDEDLQMNSEVNYSLDYNGKIVGKEPEMRQNIFIQFKSSVPFDLDY